MGALLKKVERVFGIDMRYLLHGSSWTTASKIIASSTALLLSVLYARYLSKEVYGNYRYVLSVLSIVGIFAIPGMGVSMTRSIARGYEGTYRTGGRMIFLASLGILIAGVLIGLYFLQIGDRTLALGFLASSLFVPFVEGLGNWRAYYDGKRQFKKKAVFNIIDQLFYSTCMLTAIGCVVFLKLGYMYSLIILLIAYSVGEGLPNFIFFTKTLRLVPKSAQVEPKSIRYGMHLSFLSIPSTIANYIDAALLYAFVGPQSIAIYSFAIALPEQMKSYLGVPADILFPTLSSKTSDYEYTAQLKKRFIRKVWKLTIVTFFIVALYIVSAPMIYKILFPRYVASIHLSQIYTLSLLFFPFSISSTALKATGNIKTIYISDIGAPIIQILALALLIPSFGLWGAVWGRIIGRTANILLTSSVFILHDQ